MWAESLQLFERSIGRLLLNKPRECKKTKCCWCVYNINVVTCLGFFWWLSVTCWLLVGFVFAEGSSHSRRSFVSSVVCSRRLSDEDIGSFTAAAWWSDAAGPRGSGALYASVICFWGVWIHKTGALMWLKLIYLDVYVYWYVIFILYIYGPCGQMAISILNHRPLHVWILLKQAM